MITLTFGLRAFKHPLTVLSIVLLVLNDHVLKTVSPSWLTGKLSDFAGLFFFPFLLTALLALPLEALGFRPRRLLALGCLITALWFTSIKTVPPVNDLTERVLAWLLGAPAQIVLDPTDLLALPMVGCAWWLGVRVEQAESHERPGWVGYAALGAAALATMATAPCPPVPEATRLLTHDGALYARLTYDRDSLESAYVVSNNGSEWKQVDEPPEEVVAQMQQPANLPLAACDPNDSQHCYRIAGDERVEESPDGGTNWTVSWEIPEGRREFMERWHSRMLACRGSIDMGPYDLAWLGNSQTVVVAMGNEGVLARSADGPWERNAVLRAEPTPFTGADYYLIVRELLYSALAAVVTFLGLSAFTWAIVLWRIRSAWSELRWLALTFGSPLALVLLIFLGEFLGRYVYYPGVFFPAIAAALAGLVMLVGLVYTWANVATRAAHGKWVWVGAALSLLAGFAVYIVPDRFLTAWMMGVIPFYRDALAAAVTTAAAVAVLALLGVIYIGRRARG